MSGHHQDMVAAVGKLLQDFSKNVAVAVSGGIDSLTLATIAGRCPLGCDMFHAVSPAVPPEATARVRDFAAREGWRLHLIDAGEFARAEYIANPVNRCFYCKQSLYGAITAIAANTSAQIVSGTNLDDLQEYRPGLDAARDHGVRHPFAELGVAKADIRSMARVLGLHEIADLPSSPCLSSRVETGICITPAVLRLIHAAESAVRACISANSVRCRVRERGIVLEIDALSLSQLTAEQKCDIAQTVGSIFASAGEAPTISLAPYRVGSAFLVNQIA